MKAGPGRFALATALLVGCAAGGAQRPAGIDASNDALPYYPLLPGWGWAYDLDRDGTRVLALYSVAERRPDLAVVQHVDERLEYRLLPDGIARRDGGDYILKSPLRAGASWPVTGGTATLVENARNVTLPSGDYRDCITVEEVRRDPYRVTRTTYCRGVGPVEIEMRVANPATGIFDVSAHARLRNVSRPESAP